MGAVLDAAMKLLAEQIKLSFCFFCELTGDGSCPHCREKTAGLAAAFLKTLPAMQKTLMSDVQAAYEGDPAATCPAETVFWLCAAPGVTRFWYTMS